MAGGLRGRAAFLALVIAGITAAPAVAQERPAPAAEFTIGAFLFPDDGEMVRKRFGGGGVRIYVSPRVSVGPEIAFVDGRTQSHLMLTGNVTFDFLGHDRDGPPPVTPFVVVGAGLFRTSEEFGRVEPFTHTEGGFTAGGGLRGSVGRHFFFGAEARVGWETHVRLNALVGVRFGG
jgi:hypothetical protein